MPVRTFPIPLVRFVISSHRVEWHMQEGETFEPVKHVATVRGQVRHLLLGERVALNLIARCSGIATKRALLLLRSEPSLTLGWQVEADQGSG